MSKIAIVILNYNGEHYIKEFLPSVIEFSNGHDIHIVDNASTDGSVALIQQQFPSVKIHEFESNIGFSKGYNKALKEITAEYYVILNSDVKVTDNWIEPIINLFEEDKEIAAIQPKILSLKEPELFEYAGAGGGFIDKLGYPFCRGRIFNTLEKDNNQYDNNLKVFWASGACLFIRSSAYHEVSGFDEDFFAHMEEIDLCWRIQNKGKKIYYCGSSMVYHLGGGTLSHVNPYKTYLNFSNSLTMLLKNDSIGSLLWKMPLRALLDLIAAIKFSFFDSRAHGMSVVRAHLHFWKRIGYNIRKRKETNKNIKTHHPKTIYSGSIVLDYFVKGKKYFAELNSRKF